MTVASDQSTPTSFHFSTAQNKMSRSSSNPCPQYPPSTSVIDLLE